MKNRPTTLVRQKVNEQLRIDGERPITASELKPALDAHLLAHPADWMLGPSVDIDELDPGRREELDIAAEAVHMDTMAVRRRLSYQRRVRDQSGVQVQSHVGYAPDWWDLEIERLFDTLRPLQEEALRLIQVRESAPLLRVEQVPGALRDLAADANQPLGEQITLDVPYGYYDDTPLLIYRCIVFDGRGPDMGLPRESPGLHPLRRLQALVVRVEHATGCRQWEAIGFLLCDDIPWVPAIELQIDRQLGSTTIRVRHPEIPIHIVTAAYVDARRELAGGASLRDRTPSGWPSLVYGFVSDWRTTHPGRLSWLPIFAGFAARYPSAPYVRHSKLASFRETFYREARRRKAVPK